MKKWLIIFILLIGVALAGYFYVFHKPHRNVQAEEASVHLRARELFDAYKQEVSAANAQYLDQVVEIRGAITELDDNHLILEPGIYCQMAEGFAPSGLTEGGEVTVKGRVVSFDELFEEVRVDQASLVLQ